MVVPMQRKTATARKRLKEYESKSSAQKDAARVALAIERLKSRKGYQMGLRQSASAQIPRGFVGARGDYKFFDVAQALHQCDTTGSITHLSIIPQGTSVNTREGKGCRVTSVNVRGHVSSKTNTIRAFYAIYLVWDYQPNKVLAAITDILDSANSRSFPKRENNDRFKIIKKYYGLVNGEQVAVPAYGMAWPIDDYVRLPDDANILCTTTDTTGAIGNTIQGALLLVTVGDVAAGLTAAETQIGFRLNFTENQT